MNTQDENTIFNKIVEIKKSVNDLIADFGEKDLCKILNDQFGLSRNKSSEFLELIQDMEDGFPHDALPNEWFFKSAPSRIMSGILKKHVSKIRRERDGVVYVIKQFRKYPEKQRTRLLNRWPRKYWDMLQEKPVDIGDERYDKLPASILANMIIAERYNSTWSTIESYCK